jgi:hypothetical protein
VVVVLVAEMLMLEPQQVLLVVLVVVVLKMVLLVTQAVAEILPQLLHRKEIVAELVTAMALLGVVAVAAVVQEGLVQTLLLVAQGQDLLVLVLEV